MNTKEKKEPKKRGRKPKGGKLISNINVEDNSNVLYKPNIILHLRCKSNNDYMNTTQGFNTENKNITYDNVEYDPIINNKSIWNKLRILNKELHGNNTRPSKTCFWDTCEFSTPPCFIPIEEDNKNKVYGTFCSPECAVAYLFDDNIDTTTKWERYALLNKLYKSIYNYDTNIKSAPDPRYILDKYFGNITISEYRSLNTIKHKQFVILNKPITIITPELCESNNEISNITSFNKKKTVFS